MFDLYVDAVNITVIPLDDIRPMTLNRKSLNPEPIKLDIHRRFWWMLALGLFAIAFGGSAMRMIPGGPFISTTFDVLATLAASAAIIIGMTSFRTRNVGSIYLGLLSILISCIAISNVVTDVLEFWFARAARGALIGL